MVRAVVQRVLRASVVVEGKTVGKIEKGACVLLGLHKSSTKQQSDWIAKKLLNLRLWPDKADKPWSTNVVENDFELLIVSQFTLHAVLKGNRPDFHEAMDGKLGKPMYDDFLTAIKSQYKADKVQAGIFGADMKVELVNDGPVTILLDSADLGPAGGGKDKAALKAAKAAKFAGGAVGAGAGRAAASSDAAAAVESKRAVRNGADRKSASKPGNDAGAGSSEQASGGSAVKPAAVAAPGGSSSSAGGNAERRGPSSGSSPCSQGVRPPTFAPRSSWVPAAGAELPLPLAYYRG